MSQQSLFADGIAKTAPSRGAAGVAVLWLAASVALALAWMDTTALLPDLQRAGTLNYFTRSATHAAILGGLWLGLAKTTLDFQARTKFWLAVAIPFTLWLVVVYWLALTGAFQPRPLGWLPTPAAIFAPVIIGLPLLLRSRQIGTLLDAMPPSWLIGLQVYRVLGSTFLLSWARGDLSSLFALPAGIGDMTVGVLALPAAYLLWRGAQRAQTLGVAWNILGLLDFAIAISIGILTTLHIIAPDRPNVALGLFPSATIPAFAVPSSILLHALSLRQLARRRASVAR